MTPYFLGQISPNPLVDGDQYQSNLPPFTLATDAASFSFPILFSNPQDQGVSDKDHHTQRLLLQQQSFDPLMIGGSSGRPAPFPTSDVGNGSFIERDRHVREEDPRASGKWMSSKMRIMRKMMDSDRIVVGEPRTNFQVLQDQLQPINQGSTSGNEITASCGIIRVCSDCNTTKTPLWRERPSGPKASSSLAIVVMHGASPFVMHVDKAKEGKTGHGGGGRWRGLAPSEKPSKVRKEKRSDADRTVPFKKRYKIAAAETSQTKLRFDDITISLSKDSAFHRVFPQDERDAAILLMALSCGLISR